MMGGVLGRWILALSSSGEGWVSRAARDFGFRGRGVIQGGVGSFLLMGGVLRGGPPSG